MRANDENDGLQIAAEDGKSDKPWRHGGVERTGTPAGATAALYGVGAGRWPRGRIATRPLFRSFVKHEAPYIKQVNLRQILAATAAVFVEPPLNQRSEIRPPLARFRPVQCGAKITKRLRRTPSDRVGNKNQHARKSIASSPGRPEPGTDPRRRSFLVLSINSHLVQL